MSLYSENSPSGSFVLSQSASAGAGGGRGGRDLRGDPGVGVLCDPLGGVADGSFLMTGFFL